MHKLVLVLGWASFWAYLGHHKKKNNGPLGQYFRLKVSLFSEISFKPINLSKISIQLDKYL